MTKAIVVGGGLAGLSAADVLSQGGVEVTIFEERGRLGGLVASGMFHGVEADIGAESFAARSQEVADLCEELGLEVGAPQGSSWVWSHEHGGHGVPIPFGQLGIPTSETDPDVQKALTPAEMERLGAEPTLPPSIWADDLATLVEKRLGKAVLDKLTRPIAAGIYGADPEKLAVDTVCPGLKAAFSETGSLIAAVKKLKQGSPRHAVLAPVGGMFKLPQALQKRCEENGVKVYPRTAVTQAKPTSDGWVVTTQQTRRGASASASPIPFGDPQVWECDLLVWATSGDPAVKFLRNLVPIEWELATGAPVVHLSMAVKSGALDQGPRGSGMLVAPGTGDPSEVQAKALTHYSYKWPWAARSLGPHHHLLRVSYGRAGQAEPNPSVEDALADASRLLGVPLEPSQVLDYMSVHWGKSLPPHTPEHRENLAKLREDLGAWPTLAVVGAWSAGSGIAAVIPAARAQAQRLLQEV